MMLEGRTSTKIQQAKDFLYRFKYQRIQAFEQLLIPMETIIKENDLLRRKFNLMIKYC